MGRPRKDRPGKEELEKLYGELGTITAIAKKLGFGTKEIGKLLTDHGIAQPIKKYKLEKEELEKLYIKFGSIRNIARQTGLDRGTIKRSLLRYNIEYKVPIFNVPEIIPEKDDLEELYKENASLMNIQRKTGLTKHFVAKYFKEYDIKRLPIVRLKKYLFNEYLFEEIDNPEMWYWLGFLTADGCVHNDHIRLKLSTKDYNHVEKFNDFINSTPKMIVKNNITTIDNKEYYSSTLSFYSRKIAKSLEKYNIIDNKTYNLTFPIHIKDSPYLNVYMRGVIDGDGGFSVYNNKNQQRVFFRLCGTYNFIYVFNKVLVEKAKLPPAYYNISMIQDHRGAGICYNFMYASRKVFIQIINWLYQDLKDNPNAIYLDRKYEIIKPYLDFNLIDMSNIEYKGPGLKPKSIK
jgi:hypothetical protein